MVPGSTLMYGSSFCMVTRSPRLLSNRPSEEAVSPLPNELVTPPVTKMCFAKTLPPLESINAALGGSTGRPPHLTVPGAGRRGWARRLLARPGRSSVGQELLGVPWSRGAVRPARQQAGYLDHPFLARDFLDSC